MNKYNPYPSSGSSDSKIKQLQNCDCGLIGGCEANEMKKKVRDFRDRFNKDIETNPQVIWKQRRKKVLSCSYCPPHRGENRRKVNRHKTRKSRNYQLVIPR